MYKILSLLIIFFITFQAVAEEQVLLFKTTLYIQPNRTIRVKETLRITVEGDKVRQGIIRALPLTIQVPNFPENNVSYSNIKVFRNGQETPYISSNKNNMLVLQIYKRGVFLEHTEHVFEIEYLVSGYNFDGSVNDVLYWPVTGQGWPLPINLAEASVTFPPMVLPENVLTAAYTGKKDSLRSDLAVSRPSEDRVHYTTLQPLEDGHGFIITAEWPKGFFKDTELLSVPGSNNHEVNSKLLSVPGDDDPALLTIPDENTPRRTATGLNPELFKPDSIDNFFAEIRINASGVITVVETITVRTGQIQGILRTIPAYANALKPEYALVGQVPLAIETRPAQNKVFLIAPDMLNAGTHTFIFQYLLPDLISSGTQFDTVSMLIGDSTTSLPHSAIGARVYLPEYMLPNKELVSASLRSASGEIIESAIISEQGETIEILTQSALPPGGTLAVELLIPKGFIRK